MRRTLAVQDLGPDRSVLQPLGSSEELNVVAGLWESREGYDFCVNQGGAGVPKILNLYCSSSGAVPQNGRRPGGKDYLYFRLTP